MASDRWSSFARLSVGLLLVGCGAVPLRRFPQGRAALWKDDDTRPIATPCRPDPEELGHLLCAPETYVSPFAWDALDNSMFLPLSRALAVSPSREAVNVNALDEVPDSSWFENRLSRYPLTPEQVALGPCADGKVLDPNGPAGSWVIDQGKPNGANPGFRVRMEDVGKFMLKADIASEPERATAAAAIATRIYWAAGYFTPCDSVVYVKRSLFELEPNLTYTDNTGSRAFDARALETVLGSAAKRGELVRMSASRWLPGRAIGPFTYSGLRADDANDVVPHEHRRDLRGARLLAAWLNHFDSREQNSMNVWLATNASDPDSTPGHIRHYHLDFGDCFGSQWNWDGITRRLGHAYYLDFGYLSEDFVTLGLIERPWERAKVSPHAPIFGYFSARDFDPQAWRGGYPNPAFSEMTERDGAWAARIIARFSRAHLSATVDTADLTNTEHASYLLDTLIARQQVILRRYLSKLSPLADFELEGTRFCSTDLARRSGAFRATRFSYTAHAYSGVGLDERPLPRVSAAANGRVCIELPRVARRQERVDSPMRYLVVDVFNGQAPGPLRAHFYDQGTRGFELAGIERPERGVAPEP